MKIPAALALLLIASSFHKLAAQGSRSGDEARIREVIKAQESAWNAGDAAGYCANFQKEGMFTVITGAVLDGRGALQERIGSIFATIFKGSKIKQEVRKIRFTRPRLWDSSTVQWSDVAMVEIATEVSDYQALPIGVTASPDGKLRTSMLQVLVKQNGDWWVTAFHNVDVKPNPKPREQ